MIKIKESFKSNKFIFVVEILAFLVVLACIACSIRMNIVGRTLWLDEAMLAVSINTRSFLGLLHAPLDWNQSAPVIYVLIVKIFTSLFGNSEFVFRLFSIICYALLLVVFYLLVRDEVKARMPMVATAVLANLAMMLEYSNMFKPYICDCLAVILVIYLYHLYKADKIKLWLIAALFFILIWSSNPVAFFAGGTAAYEFLRGLVKKDKSSVKSGLVLGISAVLSFAIMYFVWLNPTIENTNLSDFWEDYKFPIIHNVTSLKKAYSLTKFALSGLGSKWEIILLLACLAVLINIFYKKNACVWAMTLGAGITLVASHFGFFPMSDRLFLFMDLVVLLMGIFALYWLVEIMVKEKFQNLVFACIICFLVVMGRGIQIYHSGQAYREGEEANAAIEYLEENLTEGDQLYVYYAAIPLYQYKEGYKGVASIGKCTNVRYGSAMLYGNQAPEDVEYVKNQKDIYILYTHVVNYESRDDLVKVLEKNGDYESVYGKYVYHYSKGQ